MPEFPAAPTRSEGTPTPAAPTRRDETRPNGDTPSGGSSRPPGESRPMPQSLRELAQGGLEVGVVAAKSGKGQEHQEILEQASREQGSERSHETKTEYKGKFAFIKRFGHRWWNEAVQHAANYTKNKSMAQEAMAQAGFQMETFTPELLRAVRESAQTKVDADRSAMSKKDLKKAKLKDFMAGVKMQQKEIDRQEITTWHKLREAVKPGADQDPTQQPFINQNRALVDSFRKALTGDMQAGEDLAKRLGSEFGADAIRGALGEQKAESVQLTEPVEKFFKNEVILPMLVEGLRNGGQVTEATLMKLRMDIQDKMLSKDFTEWRRGLPPEIQAKFADSLSYGTNIIPAVQEALLPQLMSMADHLQSTAAIEQYVNEMVLNVNVGTLKSGEAGMMGETKREEKYARSIRNEQVKALFDEIQAGRREGEPVVPGTFQAAVREADARNKLLQMVGGHNTAGIASGLLLYGIQRAAGVAGHTFVPILGGAAVAGIVRAGQEKARFTRDVEIHRRQTARGITHEPDAKRRNEQDKILPPQADIQTQFLTPLAEINQQLAEGRTTNDVLGRAFAVLADAKARLDIMDVNDIQLFSKKGDKSLNEFMNELHLTKAKTMAALEAHFTTNPNALRQFSQTLGVPPDSSARYVIDVLSASLRENIQNGTALDARFNSVIGTKAVGEKASIQDREKAMKRKRLLAQAKHGVVTFVSAAAGGTATHIAGEQLVNEAAELFFDTHTQTTTFEKLVGYEDVGPLVEKQAISPNLLQPSDRFPGHEMKIPPGTTWVPDGDTGNFNLVAEANPDQILIKGGHFEGNEFKFDESSLLKPGEDVKTVMEQRNSEIPVTGENGAWKEHATTTDHREYYGYNTRESELNELRGHTIKQGDSIIIQMQNMGISSQDGLIPPHLNVQDVIKQGHAQIAFSLPGELNSPIIVNANEFTTDADGQIWASFRLNPKADPSQMVQFANGTEMPLRDFSNMMLNKDAYQHLSDGDIATEMKIKRAGDTGPAKQLREVFNLGGPEGTGRGHISTGRLVERNGEQVWQSFATMFGTGETQKLVPVTTINAIATADQPFGADFPPIVAGPATRKPLEAGDSATGEAGIPPGQPIEYYGYFGGAIDPRVKEWLEANKSETLRNNPKAELDPYQEAQMYFDKQDPAYKAEIAAMAEGLPPLSKDVKAVICIPVAGHQEGKQIFSTLENYTNQTASNNSFEVQLFVNRPETDDHGNPTNSTETMEAIARFQAQYPDFPLRVVERVFPLEQAKIGRMRKYGTDLALYRSMQRGEETGDIIMISNDADNKGVAPRYIQTYIDRFDKNPHTEAMLGMLDWDPEAYAQYPVAHIGTRLFQYLNIIGRHRSGRMVSSGANSGFKGSAYAAIGGYVINLEGGEDIAIGRSIISARGDDYTRLAHATPARLYTSARRAIDALQRGLPPADQWRGGFGANDALRLQELGTEQTIDYDDPQQVTKLQEDLEWVINTTIDMYEDGDKLGKNSEYYRNAMRYLGIRYFVLDGKIKITNMPTVARNLKNYREIAVLQRDIISGKGGQTAKDRLRQLREQFDSETNPALNPDGTPTEPKEIPGIEDRLARFNTSETILLPDIPSPKYSYAQLEQSEHKQEFGDYVLCTDKFLDREGKNNVVAGYNKSTGQLMAFKLVDTSPDGRVDPALQREDFVKQHVEDSAVFTYETKFDDGNKIVRAYPIVSTDLEGYLTRRGTLNTQQALGMLIKVNQGLRQLHKQGRGHFDVASSNVFLGQDGKIYIADFDSLVSKDDFSTRDLSGGNVQIKPPELYENNPDSLESVDTYQAAVLLYQSLVGETPYSHLGRLPGETTDARRQRFYEAKKSENYTIPDEIPDPIKAIIRRGLNPDPRRRYQSMDQMLNDMLNEYDKLNGQPTPTSPDGTRSPEPVSSREQLDVIAEQTARETGRQIERIAAESSPAVAERIRLDAAQLILRRSLTPEETTMVTANTPGWGEALSMTAHREMLTRRGPAQQPTPQPPVPDASSS